MAGNARHTTPFCAAFVFVTILAATAYSATPEEIWTQIHNLRKVEGKPQEAAELARQFLANHSALDMIRQKIHYEYGAALFQQEKFAEAKAEFQAVVADYQNTELDKASNEFVVDDSLYFSAMLEQNKGDKDTAALLYESLVDNYPSSNWRPNSLLTLGDMQREKGEFEKCLGFYEKVVTEHPDSNLAPQALFWANRTLMQTDTTHVKDMPDDAKPKNLVDNRDKLYANLKLLMEKYPESPKVAEVMFDLMNYEASRGNVKESFERAEYIIANAPDSPAFQRALVEYLMTYSMRNKTPDDLAYCVTWLDAVIENAEKDEKSREILEVALYAKGNVLLNNGKPAETRELVDSVLASYDWLTIPWDFKMLRASTYFFDRDYQGAQSAYNGMLADDAPEKYTPLILLQLGDAYLFSKEFNDAEKVYQRIIDEFPDRAWPDIAKRRIADIADLK